MDNLKNREDFLSEGNKNWIAGAIANRGALKASLGMDKEEILKNSKINHELARLKKKDKDPKKPGAQLATKDAKMFKRLNLAKTLSKLGEHEGTENYMFFQNIQNICDMCQELLEMDHEDVNAIMVEHPWAVDHIATSKDDVEEVYTFLKTHRSSEDEEEPKDIILSDNSNYTLDDWPDGEYSGTIQGYEVYSDEIDSGFKTTTGLRNAFPIPCKIYVDNGGAVVFYKNGALFSDDMTRDNWKSEFGGLENDPRFVK